MYEKDGLMVKIRNPIVLAYLRRNNSRTHTDLCESALRKKLRMKPKVCAVKTRGNDKISDCRNVLPVKVRDIALINHIVSQKQLCGVSHRHTLESAILAVIAEEV